MAMIQSLVRKASWNLIDQMISSLTNAALAVVVARSVDVPTNGAFQIAFTVFALLVGINRAIATAPLPVRFSEVTDDAFKGAAAASVGTAASIGFVSGLGCVVAGFLIGGFGGQAVLALGVVMPGLLMQDAWRQVFFAEGRPAAAALNDTAWAVVQFGAVTALLLTNMGTVGPLVLAWGGAALAAALLGIRQARTLPRIALTKSWLRDHWDLTKYVIAEFGTQQGAQQGALLFIPVVAGLGAIGALRGAQVILGVTSILAMAAFSFALPEFSRRRDSLTPRQWTWGALGLSGLVTGAGIVWGLVFVFFPALGEFMQGPTWPAVQQILFASIVGQAALAFALGPSTMLRAMDRASATFSLNAIQSPLVVIGGVGGVFVNGAVGAAWGFAAAYWAVLPLWWLRMRREMGTLSVGAVVVDEPTILLPRVAAAARHRLTHEQQKSGIVGGLPPAWSVDMPPTGPLVIIGRGANRPPINGGSPVPGPPGGYRPSGPGPVRPLGPGPVPANRRPPGRGQGPTTGRPRAGLPAAHRRPLHPGPAPTDRRPPPPGPTDRRPPHPGPAPTDHRPPTPRPTDHRPPHPPPAPADPRPPAGGPQIPRRRPPHPGSQTTGGPTTPAPPGADLRPSLFEPPVPSRPPDADQRSPLFEPPPVPGQPGADQRPPLFEPPPVPSRPPGTDQRSPLFEPPPVPSQPGADQRPSLFEPPVPSRPPDADQRPSLFEPPAVPTRPPAPRPIPTIAGAPGPPAADGGPSAILPPGPAGGDPPGIMPSPPVGTGPPDRPTPTPRPRAAETGHATSTPAAPAISGPKAVPGPDPTTGSPARRPTPRPRVSAPDPATSGPSPAPAPTAEPVLGPPATGGSSAAGPTPPDADPEHVEVP